MLRKNGIVPTPAQEQRGMSGGVGGMDGNIGSSSNATVGSSNGGGIGAASLCARAGGIAGTEELKAVLELGKRDSVKRLLKQALMDWGGMLT